MLKKRVFLFVIWATRIVGDIERCIVRISRISASASVAAAMWSLMFGGILAAAIVRPSFTEGVISRPWANVVAIAFEATGGCDIE